MEYHDLSEQLPCKVGDTIYVLITRVEWMNLDVLDFVYYKSCGFCVVAGYWSMPSYIRPLSKLGKEFFLTKAEANEAIEKNKADIEKAKAERR